MSALFYPDVPFETLYIPHIYHEIYFDKIYECVDFRKDFVAVDAGANIGIVTQYLRERVGTVYSIEPSPEHYESLLKNKTFNGWHNVETLNYALSDFNGWAGLNRFNVNRTCNSIVFDRNTSDTVTVPTIRIDTLLEEMDISHVDFMKMDIEGAEDMVLRGEDFAKVSGRIDRLIVEFHLENYVELVEIMNRLGYSWKKLETRVKSYYFWRTR